MERGKLFDILPGRLSREEMKKIVGSKGGGGDCEDECDLGQTCSNGNMCDIVFCGPGNLPIGSCG